MICVFTFFQTSVFAVSDAITLEVLERTKQGRFSLTLYLAVNFISLWVIIILFFPLYFTEMDGSSAWLGWSMVISSLSEIPFLRLANRLFQRLRVRHLLLGAGAAAALRWFLFSLVEDPYWALPVQLLHGLIFFVLIRHHGHRDQPGNA